MLRAHGRPDIKIYLDVDTDVDIITVVSLRAVVVGISL